MLIRVLRALKLIHGLERALIPESGLKVLSLS